MGPHRLQPADLADINWQNWTTAHLNREIVVIIDHFLWWSDLSKCPAGARHYVDSRGGRPLDPTQPRIAPNRNRSTSRDTLPEANELDALGPGLLTDRAGVPRGSSLGNALKTLSVDDRHQEIDSNWWQTDFAVVYPNCASSLIKTIVDPDRAIYSRRPTRHLSFSNSRRPGPKPGWPGRARAGEQRAERAAVPKPRFRLITGLTRNGLPSG